MMEKYQAFLEAMRDRSVAVLGMGISNLPLVHLLLQSGARVTVCDKNESLRDSTEYCELRELGAAFVLGDAYLSGLGAFEIIFKTPGMRFDLPELMAARAAGATVTSEMEVFFEVCPLPIIGVTGSDGKTTTTTLIAKLLEASGRRVHLGGNIGRPLLCDVPNFREGDVAVLELSSFQLHTMKKSPDIAVVTNLSPNHLDIHKSMEEYVEVKTNIFRHQKSGGRLVLNYDNEITRGFAPDAVGELLWFSRQAEVRRGVFCRDGQIWRAEDGEMCPVLDTADILLPGVHNVENYMAAIAATEGMVGDEAIVEVARSFGGVEHRIERVRTLRGVTYYNSSIDSSPARTTATLQVFPEKVILIAGGKSKGIPYDDLGSVILDHVKALVLIGETSGVILEAVRRTAEERGDEEPTLPIQECESYEQAVETAQNFAQEGDVVILSPASTSFDRFKNFEERGNLFKKLVRELN